MQRVLAGVIVVAALALVTSLFFSWSSFAVEGAYFERSSGAPAYDQIFAVSTGGASGWSAFGPLELLALLIAVGGLAGLRSFSLALVAMGGAAAGAFAFIGGAEPFFARPAGTVIAAASSLVLAVALAARVTASRSRS